MSRIQQISVARVPASAIAWERRCECTLVKAARKAAVSSGMTTGQTGSMLSGNLAEPIRIQSAVAFVNLHGETQEKRDNGDLDHDVCQH